MKTFSFRGANHSFILFSDLAKYLHVLPYLSNKTPAIEQIEI